MSNEGMKSFIKSKQESINKGLGAFIKSKPAEKKKEDK